MDIIILSGQRPNCASCGKPLPSWNPLIENEECIPCIADRVSDKLMEYVHNAIKSYQPPYENKSLDTKTPINNQKTV